MGVGVYEGPPFQVDKPDWVVLRDVGVDEQWRWWCSGTDFVGPTVIVAQQDRRISTANPNRTVRR